MGLKDLEWVSIKFGWVRMGFDWIWLGSNGLDGNLTE